MNLLLFPDGSWSIVPNSRRVKQHRRYFGDEKQLFTVSKATLHHLMRSLNISFDIQDWQTFEFSGNNPYGNCHMYVPEEVFILEANCAKCGKVFKYTDRISNKEYLLSIPIDKLLCYDCGDEL